ncbi:MAG: PAS domain-containing protein [Verrucomicrobiota bacterium]
MRVRRQVDDSMELFQKLPLPVIVFDDKGKILDVNLEAAKYLGEAAETLKSAMPESFLKISITDESEGKRYYQWAEHSAATTFDAPFIIKRSNGETENISGLLYWLRGGKSRRVVAVLNPSKNLK